MFVVQLPHLQLGGPSRGSISKLFRDNHVGCGLQDDVEVAEVQLLLALLADVIGRVLLKLAVGSHRRRQLLQSSSNQIRLRTYVSETHVMSLPDAGRLPVLAIDGFDIEAACRSLLPSPRHQALWAGGEGEAPFTNFSSGETFCSRPPETSEEGELLTAMPPSSHLGHPPSKAASRLQELYKTLRS